MISEYEQRDRPERLVVNPTWTGSAPSGITIKIPCCGSIGVHSGFIIVVEEEEELLKSHGEKATALKSPEKRRTEKKQQGDTRRRSKGGTTVRRHSPRV